jgi:hypothetical protein
MKKPKLPLTPCLIAAWTIAAVSLPFITRRKSNTRESDWNDLFASQFTDDRRRARFR